MYEKNLIYLFWLKKLGEMNQHKPQELIHAHSFWKEIRNS